MSETIKVSDKFELTGFSFKPFYKLDSVEAVALGAKQQKDLIFFKGVLIKADVPSKHNAIIAGDWVRKKKDKWQGLPMLIGHPDFKNNVAMNGRDEQEIIKDLLKFQEDYSIGRMMKVEENPSDPKLMDFYGFIDNPDVVKGVKSGEVVLPRYGSPYFWQVGEITSESFDKDGNFLVNDHAPIHWAFTNNPAMGPEIEVKAMCSGSELACMQKMQGNSYEDSHYGLKRCPCDIMKTEFKDGLDKSFYVDDPLHSLKMSSNEQSTATTPAPAVDTKAEEIKNFMEGKKDKNPTSASVPPSGDKSGDGEKIVNPGEHVDRDKEAASKTDEEKKPEETPEEKNKLETMIEEVRAKATKSAEKKFEKMIAEKDGEISKLNKTINEMNFKDIQSVINDSLPNELFGAKEEDIKKAEEKRAFYSNLAKNKNLSKEEITEILNTNTVNKQLTIGLKSDSSSKKGQANSVTASNDDIGKAVTEFMLSNKTTNVTIHDSKTTPEKKAEDDQKIKKFLNF